MGGHGALTIALKNPDLFKSVSAFAPIVSPLNCPWGHKALSAYLGPDRAAWRAYDATALIEDGVGLNRFDDILIDQGEADSFLEGQLKPHLFAAACEKAGQKVGLRMRYGKKGNLLHCWWECKLVQPLWRTICAKSLHPQYHKTIIL